jgi:hypothetical protein
MKCWEKFWAGVTGECILQCGHPNGGTVIFVRSMWVSVLLYASGLLLYTYAGWGWPPSFNVGLIAQKVTWFGAIFAAVYAALYARFASQWSYLAGVYNQIRESLVRTKESECDRNHLIMWRAAFVEDALALHLATKPMFVPFISRLLDMPDVVAKFDAYTDDGEKERERLEKRLMKRGGHWPRRAAEGVVKDLLLLPGLTEANQKDLRRLFAALCDKWVFQDLTEHDARRVVRAVAWASVLTDQSCAKAAGVVMERARAVQAQTYGFWDKPAAAEQALRSAATALWELGQN